MLLQRTIVLITLFIQASVAISQYVPGTRYTTRDGMFTDNVTCMTQDEKGYMWFGTYFGVMRYDGYTWKKIELPKSMRNKFVSSITAIGDRVYAGFWFGGGLMEFHNGRARKIELPHNFTDSKLLSGTSDSSLVIVADILHSLFHPAVFIYKKGKFIKIWEMNSSYQNITSLATDKQGRIWLGTKKGLLIFNKDHSKYQVLLKDTLIESVGLNGDGTMTVLTTIPNAFVTRIYDANLNYPFLKRTFSTNDILITASPGNNYSGCWGISKSSILSHFDSIGKQSQYQFAIPKRTVTGPLYIDREKTVWVSTEAGLYKLSNLKAVTYSFEERGPSTADLIHTKAGKLFNNGVQLYQLQKGKLTPITSFQRTGNLGKFYLDRKNNLWITQWGGSDGLWKTVYKDETIIPRHYIGNYNDEKVGLFDLYEDKEGIIWGFGNYGIFIIKDDKIIQYSELARNRQVLNYAFDNDHIWLGINGHGLFKYKYNVTKTGYRFQLVDSINTHTGLPDDYIRGNLLMDDQRRLWVGSRNGGLSCISQSNGKYRIKNFGEKEGITCSKIQMIRQYGSSIWVSTCDGIYRLNGTSVIEKYDTGDGLLNNDVNSFLIEGDTLWAAMAEGVTKLALKTEALIPPLVTISELKVLGISDTSLYQTGTVEFPSNKNSIGFVFTANSFSDERKVNYIYRLEGYEKSWSAPTTSNNINYASLPPGNYTFRVKARNAKGIWSENEAVFHFKIILPFYRTAWFAILVISIVVISIFTVRNYRISQKLKIEKLRSTIARDLHDDIGSALGTINILSRTVQRKIRNDKDIEPVVNKISKTAQMTLESMDEIIWTINPVKEKTIDLLLRMKNFAQAFMESEGIQFSFNSSIVDHHKLDMQARRHLYLAFKESVYNSVKHSGCTEIVVDLKQEGNDIVLVIADNGKGLNEADLQKNRNGLVNMNERISSLGGTLVIETKVGGGLKTTIKVPTV